MQGDEGRRVQRAANWGCEEEVNRAAAKGYGREREGKGGRKEGCSLGGGGQEECTVGADGGQGTEGKRG